MSEITGRLSKGETQSWEVPLESITLASGELIVIDGGEHTTLKSHKTYKPKTADIAVYAVDHSNFAIERPDA